MKVMHDSSDVGQEKGGWEKENKVMKNKRNSYVVMCKRMEVGEFKKILEYSQFIKSL